MTTGKRLDPDTLRATLKRLMGMSTDAWKDVDAIKDHIAEVDARIVAVEEQNAACMRRNTDLHERCRALEEGREP